MSDTGWKSPTSTGETYNDWNNPSYAYSSDNLRTGLAWQDFAEQDYYNFGLSIPSEATINGIEVEIEGRTDPIGPFGDADIDVALSYNGGTNYTSQKRNSFARQSEDQNKIYGSSSDTWGRTWSTSEFGNANFRLMIERQNYNGDPEVDHIQLKVYYTEGGPTIGVKYPLPAFKRS